MRLFLYARKLNVFLNIDTRNACKKYTIIRERGEGGALARCELKAGRHWQPARLENLCTYSAQFVAAQIFNKILAFA